MCPSSHRGGESQVQHLESGVGDEFPSLDPPKFFFFSPGVLTAQQKSDTLSCTFLFCFDRFTALSVLYQSLPAMKKSVNMGVFYNIQVAIIYSLKRRTMRVWARKAKCLDKYCNTVREGISPGVCSSRRWGCCASLPLILSPICTAITGSEV